MASSEDALHDILLIITVALFIMMVVGVGISNAPLPEESILP